MIIKFSVQKSYVIELTGEQGYHMMEILELAKNPDSGICLDDKTTAFASALLDYFEEER